MTDDLTTRLLAAIEQVEDNTLLATQPNQWAPRQPVTRAQVVGLDGKVQYDSVERAERLRIRASEDPDSVAYAVAAATAKADLVDLAAGYDLTTEPAP